MTETESELPAPKVRPIVRLGIFLISHSVFFSVVCFAAGVIALSLLPVLAKNTYISENALMPGSAYPMLSSQEVSEANKFVQDITALSLHPVGTFIESQRLIAQYMSYLGAEVNYHEFHPQPSQFHPLHFFSSPDPETIQDNASCSAYGVNTVGIIRAPHGDGKEAIVLVTPYNSITPGHHEALSLGIAFSVFSLLTRVNWLAKDVIWLVADSQHGEYIAVSAWLRDYHTPLFGRSSNLDAEKSGGNLYEPTRNSISERKSRGGFRRAGTMAAALVIKVTDRSELFEDSLHIYAEASNGQMPNLDLINVVNYLAVHRQGLRVKVEKLWSILESKWIKMLGETFESLGKLVRSLNPQWKFGIPAADYIEGTATLASSLYYQALGVPTGPHGAFRDYQVDAITLELSARVLHNEFLLRGGRLVEGVARSVNNLLEKFHQSFFLYLLTSANKFVSVGVYMIAFVLLVAPLPIVAASLYADAVNMNSILSKGQPAPPTTANDELVPLRSWKWIGAAKNVFVVQLWGAIVSFFPFFICQIPNCTPTTSLVIWILLSMLNLQILYLILGSPFSYAQSSQHQTQEWAFLKSVTISAAFIGLCLMSVINFATAEIGALLMVPLCLMTHPFKLDVKAGNFKTFSRAACNIILAFIAFPPAAFFLMKGAFQGFGDFNIGDFWTWMETLWEWKSATFLYIGMVHLPCWVLCIHILFHPC